MKRISLLATICLFAVFSLSAQEPLKQIPSVHSWKSNEVVVLRSIESGKTSYSEYNIKTGAIVSAELSAAIKSTPTVLVRNGDVYLSDLNDNETRLTSSSGEEKNPALSPDLQKVAYTRDNDLYSLDLNTLAETRLTFDGTDVIMNGWASWVYFEEIFGRSSAYRAFWWSPDSKKLAFYRFDDSKVPMFPIYYSTGQHGFIRETRYPKAGDPNPEVKLGFVDVTTTDIVWADFNEKEDQYFGTPFWGSSGADIMVQWMTRDQDNLILYAVDITNGAKKEVYKETQKTWINWISAMRFGEKGFYFVRDFENWEHIYYQSYDGLTLSKLTDGKNWGVRIVNLDEKSRTIIFTARREASDRNDVYKTTWNTRGVPVITRLSTGDLNYSAPLVSPDRKHFMVTASNVSTPSQLLLFAANSGGVVKISSPKVVLDSKGDTFDAANLPKTEMVYIVTEEGFRLPGAITYPTNFDKNKKYPVIVSIYGGPNSTNVMNSWRNPAGNLKMWADEGVIQISIDNRASGHAGKEAINYIHRNLGYWEQIDYNQWGKYLISLPFVNPEKIGITGFSYGGTMTMTALTDGAEYFKFGIAGGGVYDWLLYDSHYTERYMDHPKDNKEGYERSAVHRKVKKYTPEKGSLALITHGTGDDNVHYQNTLQLVTELQREGKHFELMLYPEAMHGYRGFQGEFSAQENIKFWRKVLLDK